MAAVVYAFGNRDQTPRPWDNHELAELYRVVDLLGRAGLSVETDMGLSDEGDPWFAFCRADTGDVAVHIARIDSHYVAASAIIGQTCRGANFREIIDQLIRQQPLVMPPPPSGNNGARLFLHPAVVLTAFVATALLHSHQAEAADNPGSAIDVVLGLGKDDVAGHKLGGVSTLIKMLLTDPGRPLPDRTLARLAQEAEPGTPLSSLMAIAIAAIAPLAEQTLALPDSATVHAGNEAVLQYVPVEQLDSATPAPVHESVSALTDATAPQTDASGEPRDHFAPMFVTSARITPLTAAVDATPVTDHGRTTDGLAGPTNYSFDHGIVHTGAHIQTLTVENTSAQTGNATGSSDSTGHHISLSDVDPQALQVFTVLRDASLGGTKGSTVSTGATKGSDGSSGDSSTIVKSGSSSSSDGQTSHDSSGSTPAAPTTGSNTDNVVLNNPTAETLLSTLSSFALDGTHQLTGPMTATADVKAAVAAYEQANGGTIQLVIFDDKDVTSPVFTFTKGVLFVEDTEVSMADMSHAAGTVTINSVGMTMTLIGVYTLDAQHHLF